MIIEIIDTKTIEQIRKEFSDSYPFLSIEFYDEPHRPQEPSSYLHQFPHSKTLREIRKKHNPGMLEIHAWQKTGFVEQEFRRHFGLNVQILRRQGDRWIQTAGTDELTLQEQNETGANATQELLHAGEERIENEKRL